MAGQQDHPDFHNPSPMTLQPDSDFQYQPPSGVDNDSTSLSSHDDKTGDQSSQQEIEEERLRGDILRYLVKNSNGTYHYSSELRAIIHDVVGFSLKGAQLQFEETVTSLLDILLSDPQRRFLISGDKDNIMIKRCFVRGDEDEISDLVEEWRALIAAFLLEPRKSVGLSDIGSSVPRPMRIPSSVKLIFILKTDPENRFILTGDGNAAKAQFNMEKDPEQESLWIAKWRDDVSIYLTKEQWSVPSVSISDIECKVARPLYLLPQVKVLEVLEADPFQRFVMLGVGPESHVMIRNFRGDEQEIEEFVERWRLLVASYLLSKSAILGVVHPLLGLSEIGANVVRPPGVPTSVKLIDVMRADPRNRFIIKGDGNALRARINSGGQAGRRSFSSAIAMNLAQQQMEEDESTFEGTYTYSSKNMSKVTASKEMFGGNETPEKRPSDARLQVEDPQMSDLGHHSIHDRNSLPPTPSRSFQSRGGTPGTSISSINSNTEYSNHNSTPEPHLTYNQSMNIYPGNQMYVDPQYMRQPRQMQVHQFHRRKGSNTPPLSPSLYGNEGRMDSNGMNGNFNNNNNGRGNGMRNRPGTGIRASTGSSYMQHNINNGLIGMQQNMKMHALNELNRDDNQSNMSGSNQASPLYSRRPSETFSSRRSFSEFAELSGSQLNPADGGGDFDGLGLSKFNMPVPSYQFDADNGEIGGSNPPPPSPSLYGNEGRMDSNGMNGNFNSNNNGNGQMPPRHLSEDLRLNDMPCRRPSEASFGDGNGRLNDMSSRRPSEASQFGDSNGRLSDMCSRRPSEASQFGESNGRLNDMSSRRPSETSQFGESNGSRRPSYDMASRLNTDRRASELSEFSVSQISGGDNDSSEDEWKYSHKKESEGLIGMQHAGQYTRQSLDHILAQQNDRERMERNRSISLPQEGDSHIPFAETLFNNQGGSMTSTNSTTHLISIQNSIDSEYSNSSGHTTKASSQSQIHGLQQFQSQQRTDDHQRSSAHPSDQRDEPLRRKSFMESGHNHPPEEGAATTYESRIPPDQCFIQNWLPMVFSGYDGDMVDTFIMHLRDDGGFITVQDLIDAQTINGLTRELLANIAGFKAGHFNRLEKALAVYYH
eukprot:CAMPEP_0119035564 /NCGR_PEP_ID=MMETSP1177-20130426/2648_1 /TAXON_ID=2985 /ORGANISM="Ochromonas sp, Strain CCMP1899" /LENGTH=1104 /DNA_ID=CAMNT_0006994003 /DNA_START=168 /DNA_END=3482 /DNA_ORIENTATION=-